MNPLGPVSGYSCVSTINDEINRKTFLYKIIASNNRMNVASLTVSLVKKVFHKPPV